MYRLFELVADEYEEVGRMVDGEFVYGQEEFLEIYPDKETWRDTSHEELAARVNGPRAILSVVEDDEQAPELDTDTVEKDETNSDTPAN